MQIGCLFLSVGAPVYSLACLYVDVGEGGAASGASGLIGLGHLAATVTVARDFTHSRALGIVGHRTLLSDTMPKAVRSFSFPSSVWI